jgi:ATP-dependent Clp protease adaptor protein ClpS
MADKKKSPSTHGDEQTLVKERVKRPEQHKVVLHNDDFTPMEFVVELLETIFRRSGAESTRIMLLVHRNGIGIAGVYTREIAEAKAVKSVTIAREAGYPFLATTEPA